MERERAKAIAIVLRILLTHVMASRQPRRRVKRFSRARL